MIAELGFTELPIGIQQTDGMCGNERNAYQRHQSPAYSMDNNTLITTATSTVFPDEFPQDFSILLTIRPSRKLQRVALFSIYSDQSEKVFALIVGQDVAIYYQDMPGNEGHTNSFGVNIADDKYVVILEKKNFIIKVTYCFRWHRLGISVKGDSMTLLVDCNRQITKSFHRTHDSRISTDGLILTGVPIQEEDGYYVGDIQTFLIANTPDEGFLICSKYSPNCPGTVIATGNIYATGSSLDSAEVRQSSGSHSFDGALGTIQLSGQSSRSSSSGSSIAENNARNVDQKYATGHISEESTRSETNLNPDNLLLAGANLRVDNYQSGSSGLELNSHLSGQSSSRSAGTANVGTSSGVRFQNRSRSHGSLSLNSSSGKAKLEKDSKARLSSKVELNASNGNSNSINNQKMGTEPTDELYDYFDYGSENYFDENEVQGSNDTVSNKKKGNFNLLRYYNYL